MGLPTPVSAGTAEEVQVSVTYTGTAVVQQLGFGGGCGSVGGSTEEVCEAYGSVNLSLSWRFVGSAELLATGVEADPDTREGLFFHDAKALAFVGAPVWSEAALSGTIHQDPQEGCVSYGPLTCPHPGNSPYIPPCTTHVTAYRPWVDDGGRLGAVIDAPEEITISAWVPADAQDLSSSVDCGGIAPAPSRAGVIWWFPLPEALNDGPAPKVDPATVGTYDLVYNPVARCYLIGSADCDYGDDTRSTFGPASFAITWRWRCLRQPDRQPQDQGGWPDLEDLPSPRDFGARSRVPAAALENTLLAVLALSAGPGSAFGQRDDELYGEARNRARR